jgi:hypothetical protein
MIGQYVDVAKPDNFRTSQNTVYVSGFDSDSVHIS